MTTALLLLLSAASPALAPALSPSADVLGEEPDFPWQLRLLEEERRPRKAPFIVMGAGAAALLIGGIALGYIQFGSKAYSGQYGLLGQWLVALGGLVGGGVTTLVGLVLWGIEKSRQKDVDRKIDEVRKQMGAQ